MHFRNHPPPFSQEEAFRKPTFNSLYAPFGSPCRGQKPSLPLRKAPPFSPSLSSIVFTPPSVPPVLGDRNPQGREDVTALLCYICPTCPSPAGGSLTHSQALALSKRARDVTALRCSEPLRYKVGGASKPSPWLCGMGPPGDELGLSLDRLAYKDGYNDYMMLVLW